MTALRELAARHGVATSFYGWDGQHREVSESTLRSVLAALEVPAQDEDQVAASLAEHELAAWRRLLPPVVVSTAGTARGFAVHVPHGTGVEVTIGTEDGGDLAAAQRDVYVDPREVDGVLIGRAEFEVPADLPPGWHTLHATARDAAGLLVTATCSLIVTPARLSTTDLLTGAQRWGVTTQLYSVRSHRSWGVGDFGDLAELATTFGSVHGADFVLVNPLHAAQARPPLETSPYLPTTRRFVNPLYLRVEDVPEVALLGESDREELARTAAGFAAVNADPELIDRDTAYAEKLRILEGLFTVPRSPERQGDFEEFRAEQGPGLVDFATWCALTEELEPDDPRWTDEASGPATAWVAQRREELADRVEFYTWLQWLCDEQLAAAQDAALDAGMTLGVVHDLAVGVQGHGADAWALGSALARGVEVGAPPDDFNQQGQGWGQPPWRPDRLAELGYAPYRDMLRTVLAHAGGLRVDHILGLFRLWWIPADADSPAEGTYVTYDHEALVGILALEAERAGAVVIGEDLGVFEPFVQDYLSQRGILGTSILWFERDWGKPRPVEGFRELCLTAVTTHDLPPTAGYLAGAHIALRAKLGLLERDVETEQRVDAEQREAVLEEARARGLLAPGASVPETVKALHQLVLRSPSRLIGVALVDLVGEARIQNQPGTNDTQYTNWRIPLADADGDVVYVEDLAAADFGDFLHP